MNDRYSLRVILIKHQDTPAGSAARRTTERTVDVALPVDHDPEDEWTCMLTYLRVIRNLSPAVVTS